MLCVSKKAKIALSILSLAGTVAWSAAAVYAMDADRITKVREQEGSYCHMRFPAMLSSTLASDHPRLKSARSGDTVDYYGSCDHNPQGRDELISQRHDRERRWQNDYEG